MSEVITTGFVQRRSKLAPMPLVLVLSVLAALGCSDTGTTARSAPDGEADLDAGATATDGATAITDGGASVPDGRTPPADGAGPDASCDGAEVCDGRDNDCDGVVDEGLTRTCSDLCGGAGDQSCSSGAWQMCVPRSPAAETCDEVDNDCDGLVDEELSCAPKKPRLTVVILAGQSNMVGLGINSELGAADAAPVPQTHIYYNDSAHPNPNAMRWTGLRPGFGVLADRFGPELSFGRRLHELWPGRTVAIIKVAEGATALSDRWAAGTGDLYRLLVQEVEQQMRDLHIEWRPQIAGFVWMQGESDAFSRRDAGAYETRLRAFLERLREDIGVPLLPVTAGLISDQDLWPHADAVRSGTSRLADDLGPMIAVETNDLPTHAADPAHYDSASTLTLGRRFAEATAAMHGTSWRFPEDLTSARGDGYWTYLERAPGSAPTSLVYDRRSGRWEGMEAWVSSSMVQPSEGRSAEIAWSAPLGARMRVTVSATDAGTSGDGAEVEITDGEHVLWGPARLTHGRTATHVITLDMRQGQELFFRATAGPAGDATGDGVRWDIDVDVLDFDE